jgi:hypothetical protein
MPPEIFMEPIQEILETIREMRKSQLQAMEIQRQAVKRVRAIILYGAIFFGIVLAAYIIWCFILIRHTTN